MRAPDPKRIAGRFTPLRVEGDELSDSLAHLAGIVQRYYGPSSRFDFWNNYPYLKNLVQGMFMSTTDMNNAVRAADRDLDSILEVFKDQQEQTNGRVPHEYVDAVEEVRQRIRNAAKKALDPSTRVASRAMKIAGEVRFIKDKSNDATGWAWNDAGPQERKMAPDFAFDPKNTKPLARVLRSTNAAMGHGMAAYAVFTKIKSADVSPDGSLGGKGYIQKIAEMRRAYMNVVEALSALSDTLYDEIRAPHWAAVSRQEDPEERKEVEQIVEDAMDIKKDPEGWAEEQEEEMDEENEEEGNASPPPKKSAKRSRK